MAALPPPGFETLSMVDLLRYQADHLDSCCVSTTVYLDLVLLHICRCVSAAVYLQLDPLCCISTSVSAAVYLPLCIRRWVYCAVYLELLWYIRRCEYISWPGTVYLAVYLSLYMYLPWCICNCVCVSTAVGLLLCICHCVSATVSTVLYIRHCICYCILATVSTVLYIHCCICRCISTTVYLPLYIHHFVSATVYLLPCICHCVCCVVYLLSFLPLCINPYECVSRSSTVYLALYPPQCICHCMYICYFISSTVYRPLCLLYGWEWSSTKREIELFIVQKRLSTEPSNGRIHAFIYLQNLKFAGDGRVAPAVANGGWRVKSCEWVYTNDSVHSPILSSSFDGILTTSRSSG